MKIVLSCDALVAKSYAVSIVQALALLFDKADEIKDRPEIYTIVHHEGKIRGPLEQRKIHSTYLTSLLTDESPFGDQWWKKGYLIPGACKNLTIPCSVDLVLNVSSGFSQGISRCKEVKQITYLVENQEAMRRPKFLREKIFKKYLESWVYKTTLSCDELWVGTKRDEYFWKERHPRVKHLCPFILSNDFPLFPEATRKNFPCDFFALDAESLALGEAEDLIEGLLKKSLKFKFVGRDDHLEPLKKKFKEEAIFWGNRCVGELAPFFAAARGYITFQREGFAQRAFEAMSTGTPAWFPQGGHCLDYTEGHGIFSGANFLEESEEIFQKMGEVDIKKVHATVHKFNEIKFKAWVEREVGKILSS